MVDESPAALAKISAARETPPVPVHAQLVIHFYKIGKHTKNEHCVTWLQWHVAIESIPYRGAGSYHSSPFRKAVRRLGKLYDSMCRQGNILPEHAVFWPPKGIGHVLAGAIQQ